ncbi:hypothetical protein [Spirosoma endophyticum]|uniref:Uncharacterized protein n=1 Tax=Spirosoma endophyticum TaxID=662367 RepID=A0A1I2CHU6_9BACT|nr:hypothetical protein [Spirosoma endophyticum]SFE67901.1 hypothetical protein SAMN05216167_11792 [Spirosoma endophyticum]
MAKLLRFFLFTAALLSIAKQGSAQQLVYSLYITPTGAGAKNGTSCMDWMAAARIIPPLETSEITSSS